MISTIVICITIIICLLLFLGFEYNKFEHKKKLDGMLNFITIMAILDYHVKKAFDIIYKERIMIYSIEATKPNEQEFEVISKDFARLVIKLIGPNLFDSLVSIYGNEETLLFNLMEMFSTFFENDELFKTASAQLMETDLI